MKIRPTLFATVAFVAAIVPGHAQFIWDGSESGDPTVGANWQGGSAPTGNGNENVFFGDGATNTAISVTGSLLLRDIEFNGSSRPPYSFNGSTSVLTLTGNVAATTSGGSITFGSGLALTLNNTLSSTHTVNIVSGTSISVAGTIGESGGVNNIVKSGLGTLTLTGTNTYTGSTTINQGTLIIGADSGLGAAPGSPTIGSIGLAGGTLQTTGTFALSPNRGIALSGSGGSLNVNTGTTLTYNGIVSGSGTFTKTGPGTLVLGGANIFSATMAINAGTLTIGAVNTLPTSAFVSLSGTGTLDVQNNQQVSAISGTAGTVSIASGATLNIAGSSGSFSGALTGAGTLAKTGSGSFTLGGSNGGFSGSTTISGGSLSISSAANLGTGTLTLSGGTLNTTASFTLAAPVVLSSTGTFSANSGTTLSYSGSLTGAGSLVKSGSGSVLNLLSQASHTGGTSVNSGTLRIGTANALPASTILTLLSGATLDVASSQTIGGFSSSINGGTLQLGSGASLTVGGSGSSSFSGTITGAGTLVKSGSGTLTLNSQGSGFTGGLTISGGKLLLGGGFGGTGPAGSGAITVLGGGTLGTASGGDVELANAISLSTGATLGNSDGGDTLTLTGATTLSGSSTVLHLAGSAVEFEGGLSGPAGSSLTFDSGGVAVLVGNTSANVTSIIASGAHVIFATPGSLGSAGIGAINGGYIGVGISDPNAQLTPGAVLARITNPAGFAGTFGFDFNEDSDIGFFAFGDDLDFSAFTNPAFRIGSATVSVLTGRITPPASGFAFGSSRDGLLLIDSHLKGAAGVTVDSSGEGFIAVFRGRNSYAGNLTVRNAAAILDSAAALPAGRSILLDGSFAYLGSTTAFKSPSDFIAFAANPANLSISSGTVAVLGFDEHTDTRELFRTDFEAPSRVISGPLDLSLLGSAVYIGTLTGLTIDGTVTAPSGGVLKLATPGGSNLSIRSNLLAGNVGSVVLGIAGFEDGDSHFSLTGSNTYSGGTTLASGTTELSTSSNLGAATPSGPLGTGTVTVAGGSNPPALASMSAESGSLSSATGREVILGNAIVLNNSLQLGQTEFHGDDPMRQFNRAGFSQLVLSGAISGAGGLKVANSRTVLSGANSYTGVTEAGGGTLILGSAGSISAGTQLRSRDSGYIGVGFAPGNLQTGFLDRFDKAGTTGSLGLDSLSSGGTFTGGGSTATYSGNIDLTGFNSQARIGSATSAVFSGTLTPASSTSYRFGGGGGLLTVSSSLTNGSGSRSLVVDSSFGQPLTLRLTGTGNTYTGSTQVTNSALIFGAGALASSSTFNLSPGGYIGTEDSVSALSTFINRFSAGTISGIIGFDTAPAGSQFTISGNLDLTRFTSPSPIIYIGSATSLRLASSASITLPAGTSTYRFAGYKGGSVQVDPVLSGSTSVVIGDPHAAASQGTVGTRSTVSLTGNNTYTGGTTLFAGGLIAGTNTALGSGTLVVQPMNSIGGSGHPALSAGSGVVLGNSIALNTDLYVGGSNSFTLAGMISGVQDAFGELAELYKVGSGTLTLSGNNTFGGGVYIEEGTVNFGSDTAAGTGMLELGTASGPTANFLTASPVVGGLSADSAADRVLLASGATLTINQSDNTLFAGTIQGGAGASIVKNGPGRLTLATDNSYSGSTTVAGGVLSAASNGAFGTSAIFIGGGRLDLRPGVSIANAVTFSGASGAISGNGTLNTPITVGSGNKVFPGSSTGTLTFAAGLVLGSGGFAGIEIQDASGAAGVGYDLIAASGFLAGVGTSVQITATSGSPFTIKLISINDNGTGSNFIFDPTAIQTWTVLTAANGISGFDAAKFSIDVSAFRDASAGLFTIASTGSALDITFTPVPEPSTWAMMIAGVGALVAGRIRRRRQ